VIVERIHESRKQLIREGVLDKKILNGKTGAKNNDLEQTAWKHLMAGNLFFILAVL
jgi:hypothetical protein